MNKQLRILGWSLLTVALVVSLILGGFQWGTAKYKTPDFAQSYIGDMINLPILRIGNPLYASTAVDYTIDGAGDHIQFQAALDTLPATGGILQVVSSGTISFGATVSRAINNVTIVGTGPGTYFTYDASTPIFSIGSQSGWIIRDCRFDAGSVTYASATKYTLDIMVGVIPLKVTDANVTVSNLTASGLTLNQSVFATTNGLLVSRSVSGATFPTTPIIGESFLHVVTGRKILYQYDGTTWQSIQSYGTMTIYVDNGNVTGTVGTDDILHGTATGTSAFATIQYAIDAIPGIYGGAVTVYIATGTYNESLIVKGKQPAGNYYISIYGTLNQVATGTMTSGVAGTGATRGSITHTDNVGAWTDKLVKVGSEYRLIDSITSNDLMTIVGTFSASISGTYTIYDWATIVTGVVSITLTDANSNLIIVNNIDFHGSAKDALATGNAILYFTQCRFYGYIGYEVQGDGLMRQCLFQNTGDYIRFSSLSHGEFIMSKLYCNNSFGRGVAVYMGADVYIDGGCVFDGVINNQSNIGVYAYHGGIALFDDLWATVMGNAQIRNCQIGIYATTGGLVLGTSTNQYSNNGVNELATNTTLGYID